MLLSDLILTRIRSGLTVGLSDARNDTFGVHDDHSMLERLPSERTSRKTGSQSLAQNRTVLPGAQPPKHERRAICDHAPSASRSRALEGAPRCTLPSVHRPLLTPIR